MIIGIGNDHSAVEYKHEIITLLTSMGHTVINYGTDTTESVDYPDIALKVANEVAAGHIERGILICGTGIGMELAANKVKGIRAVVCSETYSAKMSRNHNNTNILCFGARVVGIEVAKQIVTTWMSEPFEGERHQRRIDKIMAIENQ